jgi:hypothetical protein
MNILPSLLFAYTHHDFEEKTTTNRRFTDTEFAEKVRRYHCFSFFHSTPSIFHSVLWPQTTVCGRLRGFPCAASVSQHTPLRLLFRTIIFSTPLCPSFHTATSYYAPLSFFRTATSYYAPLSFFRTVTSYYAPLSFFRTVTSYYAPLSFIPYSNPLWGSHCVAYFL